MTRYRMSPSDTLKDVLPNLKDFDTIVFSRDVELDYFAGDVDAYGVSIVAYPGVDARIYDLFRMNANGATLVHNMHFIQTKNMSGIVAERETEFVKIMGTHTIAHSRFQDAHAKSLLAIATDLASVEYCSFENSLGTSGYGEGINQDHLIYVSAGSEIRIRYSSLRGAPNGRGIKIGNDNDNTGGPSKVYVIGNAIWDCASGNISFSYDTFDNIINRNLLVEPSFPHGEDNFRYPYIHAHGRFHGQNNRVHDNIGAGSSSPNFVTKHPGIIDKGNNIVLPLEVAFEMLPQPLDWKAVAESRGKDVADLNAALAQSTEELRAAKIAREEADKRAAEAQAQAAELMDEVLNYTNTLDQIRELIGP